MHRIANAAAMSRRGWSMAMAAGYSSPRRPLLRRGPPSAGPFALPVGPSSTFGGFAGIASDRTGSASPDVEPRSSSRGGGNRPRPLSSAAGAPRLQTQAHRRGPASGGRRGGGGGAAAAAREPTSAPARAGGPPPRTGPRPDPRRPPPNSGEHGARGAAAGARAAAPDRLPAASGGGRPRRASRFHRPRPREQQQHRQKHRQQYQRQHQGQHQRHRQREQSGPRAIPTSPWVCITEVPPLSSLDDILEEVGRVMGEELRRGIVDLDEACRMLSAAEPAEAASDERRQEEAEGAGFGLTPEESAAIWESEDWDGADVARPTGSDAAATASDVGEERREEENEEEEEEKDGQPLSLPIWTPPTEGGASPSPRDLILEARLLLSVLGRPRGWYVRLPNRSCVHALLSHDEEGRTSRTSAAGGTGTPLTCGTKVLTVGEFLPPPPLSPPGAGRRRGRVLSGPFGADQVPAIESSFDWAVDLRLDATVVRVENCPAGSGVEDVRYLFRRYDLVDERTLRRGGGGSRSLAAVELLVRGDRRLNDRRRLGLGGNGGGGGARGASAGGEDWEDYGRDGGGVGTDEQTLVMTNTFLVRFDSAADARAAIREMQMVDFMGRRLRLAQYPRQLLSSEENQNH